MLFCKITGSVVGMNAVCGFTAYNILDRFSEFFADKAASEEYLLLSSPLLTGAPDDGMAGFAPISNGVVYGRRYTVGDRRYQIS